MYLYHTCTTFVKMVLGWLTSDRLRATVDGTPTVNQHYFDFNLSVTVNLLVQV